MTEASNRSSLLSSRLTLYLARVFVTVGVVHLILWVISRIKRLEHGKVNRQIDERNNPISTANNEEIRNQDSKVEKNEESENENEDENDENDEEENGNDNKSESEDEIEIDVETKKEAEDQDVISSETETNVQNQNSELINLNLDSTIIENSNQNEGKIKQEGDQIGVPYDFYISIPNLSDLHGRGFLFSQETKTPISVPNSPLSVKFFFFSCTY